MSVAYDRDNGLIYTGGHDGTLIAWQFETGYLKFDLHTGDKTCRSEAAIVDSKSVDCLLVLEERKLLLSGSADQKMRFWDVQKLAGGDIIYTMPPYVLEPLFEFGNDMIFQSEIDNDDVPQEVMDKLLKIPYCVQAYDPNGLALEQFNDHPATLYTVKGFSEAAAGLEEYVGPRM